MILMVVYDRLKKLLLVISLKYAHNKRVRQINIYFMTHRSNLLSSCNKLQMETYFDITIASLLMLNGMISVVEGQMQLPFFFTTFSDFVCSVMTLMFVFAALFMPYWMQKIVLRSSKKKTLS